MGDLVGVALLDGDVRAAGAGQVEGARRGGDVERHAVVPGGDRQLVRADLVGRVTVGGDAVGPDDHHVDALLPHDLRRHVIADERHVDAGLLELPCGEPGALQQRARLVGIDAELPPRGVGEVDRGRGGADAGGGQGAGVAVGEHAGVLADELLGVAADRLAHLGVLGVNLPRLGQQPVEIIGAQPLHAIQGPEQVHRGGPARGQVVDRLAERAVLSPDDAAIRGGDADGRGPADDEAANGRPERLDIATLQVHELAGQPRLIDEAQMPAAGVADPLNRLGSVELIHRRQ